MRKLLVASVLVLTAALMAACGDGEQTTLQPAPTPTPTPALKVRPTPTPTAEPTPPLAEATPDASVCVINAVGISACGEEKILFSRTPPDSDEELIFLMNRDGSGLVQLTRERNVIERYPRVSPDGRKIAFSRSRVPLGQNQFDIYVVNPDGSARTNLTRNRDASNDDAPAWSPDGQRIAFASAAGAFDVYVMDADGSGQTRLTHDPNEDFSPVWSPDGSTIAFVSNRDGRYKWWLMNADGSEERVLSDIELLDPSREPSILLQGAWNPTGDLFATSLVRGDTFNVVTIDPATGQKHSEGAGSAAAPVYCHDFSLVAAVIFEMENRYDLQLAASGGASRLTTDPGSDVPGSCGIVTTP